MSLGLAFWLGVAASADARAPVLVLGLLGTTATAMTLVWPVALGAALAASAGAYATLLMIDESPLDTRAAGVAATLIVVGELVGWAWELAGTEDEPGGAWRRPAWIAGVGGGALALAWIVLGIADLARVGGLAVEAAGALAALAALVVVTRLAGGRGSA